MNEVEMNDNSEMTMNRKSEPGQDSGVQRTGNGRWKQTKEGMIGENERF